MLARLGRLARNFHRDTSGKLSVELVLIIALISIPLILLLITFKQQIIGWFNTENQNLQQDAPT